MGLRVSDRLDGFRGLAAKRRRSAARDVSPGFADEIWEKPRRGARGVGTRSFSRVIAPGEEDGSRKNHVGARRAVWLGLGSVSFAPSGLEWFWVRLPTACAVGCILAPLAARWVELDAVPQRLKPSGVVAV